MQSIQEPTQDVLINEGNEGAIQDHQDPIGR